MKLISQKRPAARKTRPHKAKKVHKKTHTPTTTTMKRKMSLKRPAGAELHRVVDVAARIQENLAKNTLQSAQQLGVENYINFNDDDLLQCSGLSPQEAAFVRVTVADTLASSKALQANLKSVLEFEEASMLEKYVFVENTLNEMAGELLTQRSKEGKIEFETEEEYLQMTQNFNAFYQFFMVSYASPIHQEVGDLLFKAHHHHWVCLMGSLMNISEEEVNDAAMPAAVCEDIFKRYALVLESPQFKMDVIDMIDHLDVPQVCFEVTYDTSADLNSQTKAKKNVNEENDSDESDPDEDTTKMTPTPEYVAYMQQRETIVHHMASMVLEEILEQHGYNTLPQFFLAHKAFEQHMLNGKVLSYKAMVDASLQSFIAPPLDEEDYQKIGVTDDQLAEVGQFHNLIEDMSERNQVNMERALASRAALDYKFRQLNLDQPEDDDELPELPNRGSKTAPQPIRKERPSALPQKNRKTRIITPGKNLLLRGKSVAELEAREAARIHDEVMKNQPQ